MRFGALIQFHNELPENLPRAVASARKLCNIVVGYDDGSTDGSGAWGAANLDYCFHGDHADWKNEVAHKSLMLEWLRGRCDWVLWIDADEAIMPGVVTAAPAMIAADPELTGICLSEINLWNDEQHYRVDRGFGDAGFLRLWKMTDELRYDQSPEIGLHRLQFPLAARRKIESLGYPSPGMLHYSWSTPEKILAKFHRYAAQGQCGENLARIGPDENAVRKPVDASWFWPKE